MRHLHKIFVANFRVKFHRNNVVLCQVVLFLLSGDVFHGVVSIPGAGYTTDPWYDATQCYGWDHVLPHT